MGRGTAGFREVGECFFSAGKLRILNMNFLEKCCANVVLKEGRKKRWKFGVLDVRMLDIRIKEEVGKNVENIWCYHWCCRRFCWLSLSNFSHYQGLFYTEVKKLTRARAWFGVFLVDKANLLEVETLF